jgi:hypothetical protein
MDPVTSSNIKPSTVSKQVSVTMDEVLDFSQLSYIAPDSPAHNVTDSSSYASSTFSEDNKGRKRSRGVSNSSEDDYFTDDSVHNFDSYPFLKLSTTDYAAKYGGVDNVSASDVSSSSSSGLCNNSNNVIPEEDNDSDEQDGFSLLSSMDFFELLDENFENQVSSEEYVDDLHSKSAGVVNGLPNVIVTVPSHHQSQGRTTTVSSAPKKSQDSFSSDVSVIINILSENMPIENTAENPVGDYVSLRLLLLKPRSSYTDEDMTVADMILKSYQSYSKIGKKSIDLAKLLVSEWRFLVSSSLAPSSQMRMLGSYASNPTSSYASNSRHSQPFPFLQG